MSVSATIRVRLSSHLEAGPGFVDVCDTDELSGGMIRGEPEPLENLAGQLVFAAALLRRRQQALLDGHVPADVGEPEPLL